MENVEAYKSGYDDAYESGDNLNPYDFDTPEWFAYEDGFTDAVNKMIAECN